MEERQKTSANRSDSQTPSDLKLTGNIGNLLIEYGHGILEEDKLLASKDKNAVEFVLNYSKLWCKCLKDIIFSLEKRAFYESECMRATSKLFQGLETNFTSVPGAPLGDQTLQMSKMMFTQAKEIELHNTKRCRQLLGVLNRQRTEFLKTRKYLKVKWKADVKKMVEAESALFKAKSSYFSRCQIGMKLREELAGAQSSLDEMQTSLVNTYSGSSVTPASALNGSNSSGVPSSVESGLDSNAPDPALMNQVVKQKAKVERLEKQLAENDKKEIEQMYAYKELVDVANNKLVDLEKSKVEIICDTRLTVNKCDEVVSDSLAELISHIFVTRTNMLSKYEDLATDFQNYVPGRPYQQILQEHIQKGTDVVLEKYQFEVFHESSVAGGVKDRSRLFGRLVTSSYRGDAPFGKFISRFGQLASTKDNVDGRHSDSDSDVEDQGGSSAFITSGGRGGTVLSSLVEFGSNLFRPDSKKASIRQKQQRSATADSVDPTVQAALEAANEREYDSTCYILTQCVDGIETQVNGLKTLGIYRVPASKVKVAVVLEIIRAAQEACFGNTDLREENPLTLASVIKTSLIGLPEPLLTYNLYDMFVEVGKALEASDISSLEEHVKKLNSLVSQLKPSIFRLAGLLFQHLKRVSEFQKENQMGAANLAMMFGPTVLRQRPKFQVANLMEFVDNKWLMKVVEVCIDRVESIFGPSSTFATEAILKVLQKRGKEDEKKKEEEEPREEEDEVIKTRTASGTSSSARSYVSPFASSREEFFADVMGDRATSSDRLSKPATQSARISLLDSKPPAKSQSKPDEAIKTNAPGGTRVSESSSRIKLDPIKISAPSTPTITKSPSASAFKSPPTSASSVKAPSPADSTSSTSSGGISGLKRLVSSKAASLQHHFQQLTNSSSSSLSTNQRKLNHSSSLTKKNKADKAALKPIGIGTDCAFIDSDATASSRTKFAFD